MKISGGRAVVNALEAWGVDIVFGIPGVHTLALYDALYEHPSIRHILVRHEQGAGFMADGYSRVSGKVGVAITTTGPAAVNALTPIGQAYAESTPLLVIASGPTEETAGKDVGALHEMKDQFATAVSVSGKGRRVSSIDEIPEAINEAFVGMQCERPRPYYLEIPLDILKAEAEVTPIPPESFPPKTPDEDSLDQAISLIREAKRAMILAGGGAKDAGDLLVRLAEQLNAPVGLTYNGLGTVPADHPLFLGGGPAVGKWLGEADLLIAVGTHFSERNTRDWDTAPKKLIHLDLDPSVVGLQYAADVAMICDSATGLQAILFRLEGEAPKDEWAGEQIEESRRNPSGTPAPPGGMFEGIVQTLRASLDRDAVVTNDMTGISYQARRTFPVYAPRTFLTPFTYGTLGFALPTAIGAKIACPDRQVVALCGDGGFLFTAQELATAKQQRLSLPIILGNDNRYNAIGRAMSRESKGREIGVELDNPDFVMYAKSFGLNGIRVTTNDQLKGALENALKADLPTLIEVYQPEYET